MTPEQRALIAEMGPYRLRSGIVVDRDGCEPGPRGGDRWKAALVAALNEIAAGAAPSEQGSGDMLTAEREKSAELLAALVSVAAHYAPDWYNYHPVYVLVRSVLDRYPEKKA
jgi:hypothetical protein